MARRHREPDPTNSFLLHAARILQETQFTIDSMPNVEMFAVERALRQLHAIHYVLTHIEDSWLEPGEIDKDVRKDTLQVFREIFAYLVETGLLDMESAIDRVCLYIVYQPRIQASLDETLKSWNFHKLRTAGNKSPHAIYELSREKAINRGYWTGDPGDDLQTALDPSYGVDSNEDLPPLDELTNDPDTVNYTEFANSAAERDAGIYVNHDKEVEEMRTALTDLDVMADDRNWGMDIYCTVDSRIALA
ncbi:hypothetical protein B0H15DRAFT_794090 [Mycena belliarum]|uniref:Integrase core domain-containing protein n=1 Tax=Mycena belliarum TaxID=1033014 RepID=A0AAD6TPM6_9AGAR|nr:hypothetical protein B0H15DRAFT_794090 [Mycena belliae]